LTINDLLAGDRINVRVQQTGLDGEGSSKLEGIIPGTNGNGGGETFDFDNAISNFVAYLDCDEVAGADTKVKLDEWSELEPTEVQQLQLADVEDWLASEDFGDCDLVGLTVKAGNNPDPNNTYHPGEGTLVFGDYNDLINQVATLPTDNVPEENTFEMTEETYNAFFATDDMLVA
jgi:hypothetical protein